MKNKNSGNIKIVSLLFFLGSSSAVLLIPAVVQKEVSYEQVTASNSNSNVLSQETNDPFLETINMAKKTFIEEPINKVKETTQNVVNTATNLPGNILSKAVEAEQDNGTENSEKSLVSESNSSTSNLQSKVETNPQPLLLITREMVENCKIITDEYNKIVK